MSMHTDEESDEVVLPVKRSNKEGLSSAETVEGKASPKGHVRRPRPGHCAGIPHRTGCQPCAERRDRGKGFLARPAGKNARVRTGVAPRRRPG